MKYQRGLVLALLLSSAFSLSAQRVTLNFKNQKLGNVLTSISRQTGMSLAYSSQFVDLNKNVSITVKSQELLIVLNRLLSNTNIGYDLRGKNILLFQKKQNNASQEHNSAKRTTLTGSVNHALKTEIDGVVTDEKGEPIVGATIMLKGTNKGTITDINGKFSIHGIDSGTLRVTSIGYEPTEAIYKGIPMTISLKENAKALNELVVTGYGGRVSQAKLTNSISKVDNKALSVGVYSNPAQALSGAVSGLKVIQTSGNPGASPTIVLRGGTNFDGSGSPLVMVDGQLRGGLSDINPDDIESMEVLKDAGATALYGARASNGVILITTKSGKAGRREISLTAKLGLNYVNVPYKFLDARDYITVMRKAYMNTPWAPKKNLNGANAFGTGNAYGKNLQWNILRKTDDNAWLLQKGWEEMQDPIDPNTTLIFRNLSPMDFNVNSPTVTQDYNMSMSGGNDKGTYYAGLGYNKSDGLPISSFYKRYSFIFNGSYKVSDRIKATSNFNYNRANWNPMPGTQGSEGYYFGRLMSVPPTARFIDEDGNPMLGPSVSDGNQSYQADKWQRDYQTDKFTMIQTLEVNILKNLSLKGTANWYYSENYNESFTKDYESTPNSWVRTRYTYAQFTRDFSQTYNLVLNYNQTIAKEHNINALLGTEFYDLKSKSFYAAGSGAATDDFGDLEYTDPGKNKRDIDSSHSRYRILSYFGRLNYDFISKYLFSFVFRQDGYSSLLNHRWGFFPGVSGGWIFSEEDFVRKALPFLSFGKLRFSYGVNGNASGIGPYDLQGSYASGKYNGDATFLIGGLPNPNLRWERTNTIEAGLDFGLFDNRLNANFTFYNRLTTDKYAALTLPGSTGFSSITNNNGKLRNRGIELELSGNILRTKDFRWDMSANISYNKNTIVKLPDNGIDKNRQGGQEVYTGRQNADGSYETTFVGGYQEGQEPGVLVGYIAEGIYKSKSEIPGDLVVTAGNSNGRYQYGPKAWAALTDAQKANAVEIVPGDVKWKDINGDGTIDSFDQAVIGNTTPHWMGGVTTTLSWKGFTLYGRFDFALNYWVYDKIVPWYMGARQGTYNTTTDVFKTWSEDNPNAKLPRYVYADQLGTANYYRRSSMFAYKGNYLAVREISLSYTLPKNWAHKIFCQKLDVSVTGQNLGYITSAPVYSPEDTNPDASAGSGGGYALPRTLLFGINVTF